MDKSGHVELAAGIAKFPGWTESVEATAAFVRDESAVRMANYQKLIARAIDVFGDEIKASRWLSLPNADLGGKVPLQVAEISGYDSAVLEPIFTRIEHGIDY
jgi:uncharacterized protein (DUF2384 family)